MSVIIEGPLKEVLLAIEASVPAPFKYLRARIAQAAKTVDDYPLLVEYQLGVGVVGLGDVSVLDEEE